MTSSDNTLAKTVIAICGPTASGKTDLAINLAKEYKTSIISADSRQCFKELNIGVAKPSAAQLQEVEHFFVGTYSIKDKVDVKTFETDALAASEKIFSKKDRLVLAGGTGLYVKAFLQGIDDIPDIDEAVRGEVRSAYKEHGMRWLDDQLKRYDPRYARFGEMKNPQRMMRALEVSLATGHSIMDFQHIGKSKRQFIVEKIFLNPQRQILYDRINDRVDTMMTNGLLDEARRLFPFRAQNALQTVGYKELFDYMDGKILLDDAVELIKRNTLHYAKRQMTWFKKYFVDDNTKIIT